MRYVVLCTAVAAMLLAVLAATASAMQARELRFTPSHDWPNGTVAIAVPQSFLGSFYDLYVSDRPDCSNVLPTEWLNVGGTVYIVFNATQPLYHDVEYRFYLCYGDIQVPHPSLHCSLPGNCTYTVEGGTVSNNTLSITVESNLAYYAENTTVVNGTNEAGIEVQLPQQVYVEKLWVRVYTDVKQSYTLYMANKEVHLSYEGVAENITVDQDYDTGRHYYDTGVYTVYDFGSNITVVRGYLTVNVYDSDWDTYTVYIYVNGREVARYSNTRFINYTLDGMSVRNVSVRVYDSERNDWVRAYGHLHVERIVYSYVGSANVKRWFSGSLAGTLRAPDPFTGNFTVWIRYYYPVIKCAAVHVEPGTPGLAYAFNLRPPKLFTENVSYGLPNTSRILVDRYARHVTVEAGGSSYTARYDPDNVYAGLPGIASVDLLTSGISETVGEARGGASSGPTLRFCVRAGPMGSYTMEWGELRVYPALTDYHGLYIGPAYSPQAGGQTGSTTGGGGGAGNVSIIVQPSPYEEKKYTLALTLLTTGLLALALWLFFKAIRTNRIDYAILSFSVALADSLVNFVAQEYKVAKLMAVVAAVLIVYPVIERAIDIIMEALRGRIRQPY